ncbi:hypothetical protein TNCT_488441 [Trichonephila clavata]|uniref:Uncharacterized protein n=1 Tax=Trichonephila clavata TaxID=2740835 RepID=A0A8X6L2Q6_TRICU|nr:hypothetical protein TNCT_488441 [Trichonephila clavata]
MSTYYLVSEMSASKPEHSPVKRRRSKNSINHLRPEKSPTKREHSPVRRGRSRMCTDNLRPETFSVVTCQNP